MHHQAVSGIDVNKYNVTGLNTNFLQLRDSPEAINLALKGESETSGLKYTELKVPVIFL